MSGTVHVMTHASGGFEIGHESASGNSWGFFEGPFPGARQAINAAHALNWRELAGRCDVSVCREAVEAFNREGGA